MSLRSGHRMSALRDEVKSESARAGYLTFVWGEGPTETGVAIVGEAPGEEEARQSRPFVGRSGRLLRTELAAIGLEPGKCWITNVVKHRPTRDSTSGSVNRAPNAKEIEFWRPVLSRELAIINPSYILCFGGVAANAVLVGFGKMSTWRGRWIVLPSGTWAMATYHPSYVMRAENFRDSEIKLQFREDLARFAAECLP